MAEPIPFHTDLYRRDAVEAAAQRYQHRARIALAESGAHVVASVEPLQGNADAQALRDEFCNEVFSATARRLRDLGGTAGNGDRHAPASDEPPWALLAPFSEGSPLGLGWVLESLSPVRSGAATMALRHAQHGLTRVAIRRNGGAPLGVAHTDQLDFMVMNGGGGNSMTEQSISRVLNAVAQKVSATANGGGRETILAALLPHSEGRAAQDASPRDGAGRPTKRIAPHLDADAHTISFEIDEAGVSRLALYDAILAFADRAYLFLTRHDTGRIGIQARPRDIASTDALKVLTRDLTNVLNHVARGTTDRGGSEAHAGLARLQRRQVDMEALLAELAAADPQGTGLGFQPERGPGHENLRILNIRGTGACNSECVFCIEKFNPTHRPMPKADATRQLIAESAGQYDMLFFASGEPTIHPKLFEYVELAKSIGFTAFGMSSHFRTFADPRFALKTLQAGFEYFDIALHAADNASQLDVNPIADGGESLWEALKGLANLFRLADTLGVRISVTQKIVISRLNVLDLESIFRATYERGVRHFILQPVRTAGLAPELQRKLEISEDEMLPHLNELLRTTAGLGAVVKPYGFSRQHLFSGGHVETETNRVKNIYGRMKRRDDPRAMPSTVEERPRDGRHWVVIREEPGGQFGFASDGSAPVLDDGLQRGATLNFGCRMGSCGMCCAKLEEGRVDQSTQIFLTEEQMQAGYVLMCQARPLSDVVLRICDENEIDEL